MSTIDQVTITPGPQGWGEEFQSEQDKFLQERRNLDLVQQRNPALFERREERTPNVVTLEKIKKLQEEDGIVDGFFCRHIEKAVFGTYLDWLAQIIGSCVASGAIRIVTRRMLIEAFLLNDPEALFGTDLISPLNVSPFAPYSYRAGRKRAGLNRGDGSYCSVHIEGMLEDGILPCSAPGLVSDAYPEPQSANLYRKWGNSNSLLEQFKSIAQVYRLLESEKVNSIEQSKLLLGTHYKPQMVCSMWAFKPDYVHPEWRINGEPVWVYTRDRRNSWAHNMSIDAQVKIFTNEEFSIVDNSWGPRAHKNGSFFAIKADEYNTWASDSEQMSIGEIDMADNSSPIVP